MGQSAQPGQAIHHGGRVTAGAVGLALLLALAGGLMDISTGTGLRTVFAVCFVAACGLAALLVHRDSLRVAVVLPPLLYLAVALVAANVSKTAASGSLLTRQALGLTSALVLSAPVLLTGTGLALLIAIVRGLAGRRGRR